MARCPFPGGARLGALCGVPAKTFLWLPHSKTGHGQALACFRASPVSFPGCLEHMALPSGLPVCWCSSRERTWCSLCVSPGCVLLAGLGPGGPFLWEPSLCSLPGLCQAPLLWVPAVPECPPAWPCVPAVLGLSCHPPLGPCLDALSVHLPGGGVMTLCFPGPGCSPVLRGEGPFCKGQLVCACVCVEGAQVCSVRTVNPLGYLDTHACVRARGCVCACAHGCGIPGAAGGDRLE